MISPNTSLKLPKELLSYQTTILLIFFILTLPLNLLFFLPIIMLAIVCIILILDYSNFSFTYNDQNIEIWKGIINKSQKTIPFNTIQSTNLVSSWLMRKFGLEKVEIWTSSPAQIQIFRDRQRGYQTEHKPDGVLFLKKEDAEILKNFIISHRSNLPGPASK